MSLRIAEIFTSVQGEGRWVGTPSTFVRVSGCNLRCRWCDTPYASWSPEGPVMSVEAVLDEVARAGIRHVVLTGGEPMLFEPVVELTKRLRASGHTITIESAGTVYRDVECDLMSLSPKLANSTPDGEWAVRHDVTRCNVEALTRLVANYDFQLKFVINPESNGADVAEVRALLGKLPSVPADQVLLMAEGTDPETLHRRERLLLPIVLKMEWRLCPRWHIDLFGNVRGT